MRRARLIWAMLALARCGGDPVELPQRPMFMPPPVMAPTVEAPEAPLPPAAPAPLRSTGCAPGWRADPRTSLGDPTLLDEDPQCPVGHARFASAPACAPLAECPQDDFAEPVAPSGALVVYVKPGAGGDGRREAPFSTIAQAAALSSGSISRPLVIMLAKGLYEEPVLLGRSVTLQGACAAQTQIASTSSNQPALDLRGSANVRDLSIQARWFGARVRGGAVTFERVHLISASTLGIGSDDGTTTILRSTRIDRISDSLQGSGRALELGGEIELERVWIEGSSMGIALVDANGEVDGGTSLIVQASAAPNGVSELASSGVAEKALQAMRAAWEKGEPWGAHPRSGERWAVKKMASGESGIRAEDARDLLALWESVGAIRVAIVDAKTKVKGYEVVAVGDKTSETGGSGVSDVEEGGEGPNADPTLLFG